VFRRLIPVVAVLTAILFVQPATARPPQRIISLSPTATESLFAIGAGSQVIAVDSQSDYPKRAPRTNLSGFTPNVEAIAAYHPDLVVAEYDAGGVVEGLHKLGIRVVLQSTAKNLPEAYAQIRRLGSLTGHVRKAKAIVLRMERQITKIVRAAHRPRLSVYHELTPDYYSATSGTFIGRVYKLFGVRNIADAADSTGSGFPKLSAEYVISANPSLIVLADTRCCGQSPATVQRRPGWSGLTAVRNHAVVSVDDSVASRWGPRVVDFVRAIGNALRRMQS
jgi:iron complex transport system substrate-binding protein